MNRTTDQDESIIRLALGDDNSDNPFQQGIGLGIESVFDINDPGVQPLILSRLVPLFQRFEALKRFKLRPETMRWEQNEGDLILSFKYVNLETDEERLFRSSFKSGATNPGAF